MPGPPRPEISTSSRDAGVVLDHDVRADRDHVRVAALDDLGVLEPRAQDRDLALEQALLVLRRVVLEVLGEVAVPARDRDRLDDLLAARPLELGELGEELVPLGRGQVLAHSRERTRESRPGRFGDTPSARG